MRASETEKRRRGREWKKSFVHSSVSYIATFDWLIVEHCYLSNLGIGEGSPLRDDDHRKLQKVIDIIQKIIKSQLWLIVSEVPMKFLFYGFQVNSWLVLFFLSYTYALARFKPRQFCLTVNKRFFKPVELRNWEKEKVSRICR